MFADWVGLISLIIVNAGINIGIYKYFNARLDRVYLRIDDVKDKFDKNFVRKDVCSVMHTSTAESLKAIEGRINERLDKLEKDVSENFTKLIELMTKK
jgi:hypothetical protein